MIEFIVNTCVVRVIVRREHAVFDERSDADRSKVLMEAHVVVALVGGESPKVALRNAGDLRTLAADKGYDDMSFREDL